MTRKLTPDICIIGAGAAGLSVASGAAQMGSSVVLIEKGEMGGDCLNFGCVPSKSLLAAAARAQAVRDPGRLGVAPSEPVVDFSKVMEHVRSVIADIAPHDSQERFEGLGVTVLRDEARFVSPFEVRAGDTHIRARRFVIATGSSPVVPPIPGLKDTGFLTNETIFELNSLPEHLLILGGGPIGLEMAQGFRRLGARVTILEAQGILGREDRDASALVVDRLRAEGVVIEDGTRIDRVQQTPAGFSLTAGDGRVFTGSHLLVAVGRRPAVDCLDLDKALIAQDRGRIEVDDRLRTSNRRVYAIGDAAGGMQFTHVAGYHAGLVIRSALFGLSVRARTDHVPRVTYTDPELAQIGFDEFEARLRYGSGLTVTQVPYAGNDRARAENATDGFLRVMVHRGRPVGVTIVGAHAGDVISVWALAMSQRLKMGAIAGMIAPYPTLGELSKQASGAYFAPRLFESKQVKRVVSFFKRF